MKILFKIICIATLLTGLCSSVSAANIYANAGDTLYIDVSDVQNYSVPLVVKIEHNGNPIYYNSIELDSEMRYLPIRLSGIEAKDCIVSLGGAITEQNITMTEDMEMVPGKYISLGIYNGEELLWLCGGVDKNGFLFISDKIITNMPYSTEEKDGYAMSLWMTSDLKNEYLSSKTFLEYFTDEQLSLISQIYQRQSVNDKDKGLIEEKGALLKFNRYPSFLNNNIMNSYLSVDKIFVPDIIQVQNIAKWLGEDVLIGTNMQNEKGAWWLRTPVEYEEYDNFVYVVDKNARIDIENTDNTEIGVRPAFYLDYEASQIIAGDGTKENPYKLSYTGEPIKILVTKDVFESKLYVDIQGEYENKGFSLFSVNYDSSGTMRSVEMFKLDESFSAFSCNKEYDGYNAFFLWDSETLVPITDSVKIVNNY